VEIHNVRHSALPSRPGAAEARERLAIMKRGQILGFGALVLMLATIVTLAAIGQPWVAGIVATGLVVIVTIFVTGQIQPAAGHIPKVAPGQPVQVPQRELPGALCLPMRNRVSEVRAEPLTPFVFVDGADEQRRSPAAERSLLNANQLKVCRRRGSIPK